MRKLSIAIPMILCGVLAAPAFAAGDDSAALRRPPSGSLAAQLRLKHKLAMISEGVTLADSLNHNRMEWESLTPDQREQYRKVALAFLQKNPQEQEQLLKSYDKLIKMSHEQRDAYRQRAAWLSAVVASFSPQEREDLQKLTPEDRARKLLERRDQLVSEGKLTLEPAATPTTAPVDGEKP